MSTTIKNSKEVMAILNSIKIWQIKKTNTKEQKRIQKVLAKNYMISLTCGIWN